MAEIAAMSDPASDMRIPAMCSRLADQREHLDRCGRAARAARAPGSDSAPELALHALMALTVGDARLRHSHPDHPMRMIQDYVLAPTSTMARRRTVRGAVAHSEP